MKDRLFNRVQDGKSLMYRQTKFGSKNKPFGGPPKDEDKSELMDPYADKLLAVGRLWLNHPSSTLAICHDPGY